MIKNKALQVEKLAALYFAFIESVMECKKKSILQKSLSSLGKIESAVVHIVKGKVQQKPSFKQDIE